MSYFSSEVPSPEPTLDDAPFWEACQRHELLAQHCDDCDQFRHPPAPRCKYCGSDNVSWQAPKGDPVLFSYTIVHHAAGSAFKEAVPYNIAIVNYPDADNVRLISNIVGVAPEALQIDMPLELIWEEAGNGIPLPRFRPA